MTSNQIEEIHGKSFHHAPAVERLILNHNSISLRNPHPRYDYNFAASSNPRIYYTDCFFIRVFSNFVNLRELHLTNAFLDNQSDDLAEQLHSIFINSSLTKLEKLHLEQNEIERFSDEKVFCNLDNLLDLHLGDNKLQGLSFHILCLHHLRYVDLEGNQVQRFVKEDVAPLDAFERRNQSLILDISGNPFICDCNSNYLPSWLKSTRVTVKNNASLQCHYLKDPTKWIKLTDLKATDCIISSQYLNSEHEEMRSFADVFVFSLLCFLVIFLVVVSVRYSMEFCRHPIRTTDKVHYVVINDVDDGKEAYI